MYRDRTRRRVADMAADRRTAGPSGVPDHFMDGANPWICSRRSRGGRLLDSLLDGGRILSLDRQGGRGSHEQHQQRSYSSSHR